MDYCNLKIINFVSHRHIIGKIISKKYEIFSWENGTGPLFDFVSDFDFFLIINKFLIRLIDMFTKTSLNVAINSYEILFCVFYFYINIKIFHDPVILSDFDVLRKKQLREILMN